MVMKNREHSSKVIFLVGRDNWQKDDALNSIFLDFLKKNNHAIVWEDPAGALLYQWRRLERKIKWLPESVKVLNLRILQVLYGLLHWRYFYFLLSRKINSIELRCELLKQSILALGADKKIIVLARSSGGRVASLIGDELNLKHIIGLGYPFKHPKNEVESGRFMHLRELKTPFLIIQGIRDEYGGREITKNYAFSSAVELFFVDTDHDFRLTAENLESVFMKMNDVISSY